MNRFERLGDFLPPRNVVGATVDAQDRVIADRDGLLIAVNSVVAFPHGIEARLQVRTTDQRPEISNTLGFRAPPRDTDSLVVWSRQATTDEPTAASACSTSAARQAAAIM